MYRYETAEPCSPTVPLAFGVGVCELKGLDDLPHSLPAWDVNVHDGNGEHNQYGNCSSGSRILVRLSADKLRGVSHKWTVSDMRDDDSGLGSTPMPT